MKDLMSYFSKWEKERISCFEEDWGLIDDCKYMLYLKEEYRLYPEESSFSCKSIKEAKYFVKNYCK